MSQLILCYKKDKNYQGEIESSLITFNDNLGPSTDVIWSSKQVLVTIKEFLNKTESYQTPAPPHLQYTGVANPTGNNGNIVCFNQSGQMVDSGFSINDESVQSSSILWSSQKLCNIKLPPFQMKQKESIKDNIAIFGSEEDEGQVVDSGFRIDDSEISNNTLWSSFKTNMMLNMNFTDLSHAQKGNILSVGQSFEHQPSGLGVVKSHPVDSGFKIDDTASAAPNVLWSSLAIQTFLQSFKNTETVQQVKIAPQESEPQIIFLQTPFIQNYHDVPKKNLAYIGTEGTLFIWDGVQFRSPSYSKPYSKFVIQSSLTIQGIITLPWNLSQQNISNNVSMVVNQQGIVSINNTSPVPLNFEINFYAQSLSTQGTLTFSVNNENFNSIIGNSTTISGFLVNGVMLSTTGYISEFITVASGQNFHFSIKASSNTPEHHRGLEGSYLTIKQI